MPVDDSTGTVTVEQVQAIIDATEVVNVRLDQVAAGPAERDLKGTQVRILHTENRYALRDDRVLLVRFTHVAEWFTPGNDDTETSEPLAKASLVHVAEFSLTEGFPLEASPLAAWIDTNVYFIVYPYVRAAFSSISALLGYPVPTLGYLKRNERRPVKED